MIFFEYIVKYVYGFTKFWQHLGVNSDSELWYREDSLAR